MPTQTAQHLTMAQLQAGLPWIEDSPKDNGVLKAIVIRPGTNGREDLDSSEVSPEGGIHGDRWAKVSSGKANPKSQVTLMNARAIERIAGTRERWPLAGDNLYVDLDLSEENLQAGHQLAIGTALFEITEQPHNGCVKFMARFGQDALAFVNSETGKRLHLRGIYATVIQAGRIEIGDTTTKV